MSELTPIGITDFRNSNIPFGIKDKDRLQHIYAIGKTGVGKSTLLERMAISDIERGNGIAVIDPHGDIAEHILQFVPPHRIQDVIYFDVTDQNYCFGFNPLNATEVLNQHLILSGLIAVFKKIWSDSWGPRLEYILRYSLLSLLTYPSATLLDIAPLLTDYHFRQKVLSHCHDAQVKAFWYQEFDKYSPQGKGEAISPILNKTGLFGAILPLKRIVSQANSSINLFQVLNDRKILICNFSKGSIGEEASALLGGMMVTSIQFAALSRSAIPQDERIPFYVYVDEMHTFATLSFSDMLAEARKFKVSLFLTHQYIDQLHEKIRTAIFGNVGTIITFRVGASDGEYLAREFKPFTEHDLISLPRYAMYVKLMIDGMTSKPFSALTLPLPVPALDEISTEIKEFSRKKYAEEVAVVDTIIANRFSESFHRESLF